MKKPTKSAVSFFLLGLGLLVFTLLKNPGFLDFQNIEDSRSYYRTAREYQKNGEFKDAFYTYDKVSSGYAAYDAVLFYQAKCAAELQDEKTAILKLKTLLSGYSDSPLAPQASYSLGQAYIRVKNDIKAEKQFLETIKKYPDTDYATGSFYYLGQINKDTNKEKSAKYWLAYIKKAPSGRFAIDCIEGLKSISYKLSSTEKKEAAIALYSAENYTKAIYYLKQIPLKYSWFYLGKSYEAIGNKSKALYFYKEGLRKSSSAFEKRENFEAAMLAYASLYHTGSDKGWDEILKFSSTARDYALYQKAKLLPKSQQSKYYWEIANKYSKSQYASDSLWNLFWDTYKKGDYALAAKLGEKHISDHKNTKASPAILFWMGKISEKRKDYFKIYAYYGRILSKYPDSYYAFRATGRISANKNGFDPAWDTNSYNKLPLDFDNVKLPYSNIDIANKYSYRAIELINVGDYETVSSFIKKDDKIFESWINLQNGIISRSIVLARDAVDELDEKPDKNSSIWNLAYPIYYPDLVNQNASSNRIDPAIILSLMKEESYFNPFAMSYSNARGLMQLLPGTARDIARWKGISGSHSVQLFDPESNIKLGSAYLSHTKQTLHNNMLFAVAAYNGGPAAVERWIKANPNKDLDEFVEDIPYSQTRDYVKKVFKTYWNYKRIYNL
jgi:soluble lytic murein transglycosylase